MPNRVVEGRDRIAPLTQAAPISHVHVAPVALGLLPNLQQDELTNHLVGEGATHYEQRVPSGTNEIEEAAISEENNPVAIRKNMTNHLRFDVIDLQAYHLDHVSK